MTLTVIDSAAPHGPGELHVLRFTVEQFHAMDEAGLLPHDRPVELLDGLILEVDRGSSEEPGMNISIRHANVTNSLFRLKQDQLLVFHDPDVTAGTYSNRLRYQGNDSVALPSPLSSFNISVHDIFQAT